jgi:hypothetical protein
VISFWKLLLLVIVIGGVWAGITIYKRSQRQRELAEARRAGPKVAHVQTVACRVCGTYVPAQGATPCARADCPV